MKLKKGEEVEMQLPSGDVVNGVITVVQTTGECVRYAIECLSSGIIYLVDEIIPDNDRGKWN